MANSGRHQARLPEALAREGVLRQAVRLAPALEILEPDAAGGLRAVRRFPGQQTGSRILWATWRRLPLGWRGAVPFSGWARVADWRIARHLAACDVFHGLMGVSFASLDRAKRAGAVTLIDNPTLHPAAFRRAVLADQAEAGVGPGEGEPVMGLSAIRMCARQYEACDRIIVYSSAAARSFEPYRYGGKVVVVRPGVDHGLFAPAAARRRAGGFRVGYVGRIEAAKGVHHLIAAWKRLALADGELVLAGRVLPEMAGLRAAGVTLAGILPVEGVVRLLQDCDLFVFPSVNEGLPLAVLEAMSCGVPVLACLGTGAEDCVTSGREGLLAPGKDTEALAEAMQWCCGHREELGAMGRAARRRVEGEFTLGHYVGRLVELYRCVATDFISRPGRTSIV
jgi:glycosyltransferase involved in cell wall biosynthesis